MAAEMAAATMFERASRLKLRFETSKGALTVEDLWELPLLSRTNGPNLDALARGLSKQVKEMTTESFVVKAPKVNEELELKFELVKHVIDVKLDEADLADKERARKEQKQKIMAILTEKRDEALKGKSLEELEGMLQTL